MSRKKKSKLSSFEKKLLTLTIALLIFSPFASVCASSLLSKANYDVEVTKEEVNYKLIKRIWQSILRLFAPLF